MVIIRDTLDFYITEDTVCTIGKFDGIHNGHVSIIKRMKEYRIKGLKTAVLTFDIPPSFLGFGEDRETIMSLREKEMAFDALGIDYLIEFPFYEKTASISAIDFVEKFIVDKMKAKAVVVGTDCSFGQGGKGNAAFLRDIGPIYGFEVEILEKLKYGDKEISSTYIRELLRDGDVSTIASISYRYIYANGKLKRGASTVSPQMVSYYMEIPEGRVMPKAGVYYSLVFYDDSPYASITYISDNTRVVETYMYEEPKGLTASRSSVVLLDRMCDKCTYENKTERIRGIKETIFNGEKWHKENFDRCAARVRTVEC